MDTGRQDRSGYVGEMLGRCVADSSWQELDAALRHEAKRSLLNFVGCALGSTRAPAVAAAVRVLQPLSGPAQATVIGRPERLDMLSAAFVNAVGANLLDYDDTHLDTVIHPTAPVAPAVLALAEQRGLSGAAALHAFILGIEVECRLGNAVSPGHYARGWHITATCGVFGAAAASAKLLGLTAAQTWHALGIAASQSAGVAENLPSGAKNVGVGNAARNGLFAALMAEQGYTAAPAAIEGVQGWTHACGDKPDLTRAIDALGQRWELPKNTYKPYPCGIVLHAVIDACLALRREHGLRADAIAGVTVRGHPLLLTRTDRSAANERDARVSLQHAAAVSLLFGAAGVREFSEVVVTDPEVAGLRGRVRGEANAALPVGAATVALQTRDGRVISATVINARGSLERPLADADIEAKVRQLAQPTALQGGIGEVIDHVWHLDEAAGVGPLMDLLRGRKEPEPEKLTPAPSPPAAARSAAPAAKR